MNERQNFGLWKNADRQKETHPHFKAGKPIEIDGKQYWLSGYINGVDPDKLEAFLDQLTERNTKDGKTRPTISICLEPAKQQAPVSEDIPF
ncbi:MAG: hypothetical protein AAF578_00460 [Pseudomonadota bacterium]